jgi:NodT family efflux transporter outer membrane factor (OMF) lipoprotein
MSMMDLFRKYWNGTIAKNRKAVVLGIGTFLGCFVASQGCRIPEICKPQVGPRTPAAFLVNNDANHETTSLENSAQLGWCEFFNDANLQVLISEALSGNQELKILAQDIRIAYNEYNARRGSIFPFVNIGAKSGIEKSSRFTRNGAVENQLSPAPGRGFPEPLPSFLIAADVSWEVDIWRRLRNARDAATLRYLGTQAGRNFVITRLVAEVAECYYELLALDNRLQILDRTIEIQQTSLETAKALKEAARGTELAVQRFQAEVQKNQSLRWLIIQQITESENRLNRLAGRFPQQIDRPNVEYLELNLGILKVGIPSQLLLNRADIRQAEREVAASGLDVRVARAQFYPSLVLTAGVGYEAFNTKYLFDSPESLIYGAAGSLVAPVINRAAIKADYLSANARQLQAVYGYQQAIINAHVEVVNALSMASNLESSIELKKLELQSLEASVENAMRLFQNARGDYIDVLLAQRDLLEAKTDVIETKQRQLSAIIRAYQALGGGGNGGRLLNDIQEFIGNDGSDNFIDPVMVEENISVNPIPSQDSDPSEAA